MKKFSLVKKLLLLVAFLLSAVGCLFGCNESGALDIQVDGTEFHEGMAMPELKILSNHKGSVRWAEDGEPVLLSGMNKYVYIYTDLSTGQETSFEISITATAHERSENSQIIKDATCTEEGIVAHVCTICNKTFDPESIPMLEHAWEPEHTDGTCMVKGGNRYFCQMCEEYQKNEDGTDVFVEDPAFGDHVYNTDENGNYIIEQGEPLIPADCLKEGQGYVYCTQDTTEGHTHKKLVKIPKTDHEFTKTVKLGGENCEKQFYTEQHCRFCDTPLLGEDGEPERKYLEEYGPHNYSVPEHVDGTCMEKGKTYHTCEICHVYNVNDEGEKIFVEDAKYGDHKYNTDENGNYIIEQDEPLRPADCQNTGEGYVYCVYDTTEGHTHKQLVKIPMTDHDYSETVKLGGEDCQTQFYTEQHCRYCNTPLLDEETGEPVREYLEEYGPHDYAVPEHVDGHCMEKGKTYHKCSLCDVYELDENGEKAFVEDKEFGAHEYKTDENGNYVIDEIVTDATCYSAGSGYVYCIHDTTEDHSHKKLVNIPIVPHDYSNVVKLGGEDCQTNFYNEKHCIYCDLEMVDEETGEVWKEVLEELGPHHFTIPEHVDGTCMEKGKTYHKCNVCSEYKLDDEGEKAFVEDEEFGAHEYRVDENGNYIIEDSEVIKPANCSEEGQGYVYCIHDTTSDHSHKKLVVIPRTDHDYTRIKKYGGENCITPFYNLFHCTTCEATKKDPETGENVMEILDEFGPHHFIDSICEHCGALDAVTMTWNFGPKDAEGYTVDDLYGYSNAVVAYLIARADNKDDEHPYYDLVIRPAEGYVGPTYNAANKTEIPWLETPNGESITTTYALYVKTVTIDEGITAISAHMFEGMSDLVTVKFPDSMDAEPTEAEPSAARRSASLGIGIPEYTFYGCKSLINLENFPENLSYIGEASFYKCESLTRFPFSTTLTRIEREAFRYCSSLTAVDLANCTGLEAIGYNCFEFCPINSYIVLPNDTIDFGTLLDTSNAFAGSYHEVIFVKGDGVDSTIPKFDGAEIVFIGEGKNLDDVLVRDTTGVYYIDTNENPVLVRAFTDLDNNEKVVRGEQGVANAGANQIFTNFRYDDGLIIVYSSLQINDAKLNKFLENHDNVVRIGSYAFANSDGLTSFTLPDSVKDIGAFAFEKCVNLTSMNISETSNLQSIGASAFYNTKISSVRLPKSLKVMGTSALASMPELTEVVYDCGIFDRRRTDDNTVDPYGISMPDLLYHTGLTKGTTITIGKNATEVLTNAFSYQTRITKVDFTNASNLTTLGYRAFYNTAVEKIDLSTCPNLTVVRDEVFANCSNLTEVTLNDVLQSWGKDAFNNKEVIEYTEYTDPETGAVYKAFNGLNFLTLISVPEGTVEFVMNDGTLQIQAGAFDAAKATLTKVVLSAGLTTLPGGLFEDFTELTEITIPSSITEFGVKTFLNCGKLATVYYNGTIADWLNVNMGNTSANPLYKKTNGGGTADDVYGTLYLYDADSDAYNALTDVVIPASVSAIKNNAFTGATITSLSFEEGSQCVSIGEYAFHNCESLTEITIPESVVTLGFSSFYNAKAVTKLNYNAVKAADMHVTYTDGYNDVFYALGKTNGVEIVIGENVEVLPQGLFYPEAGTEAYPKITSLKFLGNKVNRIGDKAFYGISGLNKVYIKDMDAWMNVNFDFGDSSWTNPVLNRTGTNLAYPKEWVHPLRYVTELYVYDETADDYLLTKTLTISGTVKRYAILNSSAFESIVIEDTAVLSQYAVVYPEDSTTRIFIESETMPDIYGTEWYEKGMNFTLQPDWCFIGDLPHAHVWDAGVAIDPEHEVTCTEDGTYLYTCTECDGATKQAIVKAPGHTMSDLVAEVPATCTEDGTMAHVYCTACQKNFDEEGNEIPDLTIAKLGHDVSTEWSTNETHHFHACSRCDYKEDEGEHTLSSEPADPIRVIPPTCTEDGYAVYGCTFCQQEILVKNADKTSHVYTPAYIDGKEESCAETRIVKYTCGNEGCGDSYVEFQLPSHTFDETTHACTCGAIEAVFTYTYDDSALTATITAIENFATATYIAIPNTVKHTPEGGEEAEYKVVITANLFSNNKTSATGDMASARANVTHVYIDTDAIPNYTFYYYKGIKTIHLGKNVKTVGTNAFYYASATTEVYLDSVALSAMTSSTKAFNYCGKDSGFTLYVGEGVTAIPDYAFHASSSSYKVNVTSIQFVGTPSVTSIGASAFYYAGGLTALDIPATVTTIGKDAFRYCSALKTLNIASVESWLSVYMGSQYSNPLSAAGGAITVQGETLTNLVIPEGITTVDYYAFFNCTSITNISFPSTLTTINPAAFYGNTALTSIVIPDAVTTIGDQAFYKCSAVQSLTLGKSVTTIGSNAFYNCTAMADVYITDLAAWASNIAYGNANSQPFTFAQNFYVNGVLTTEVVIPAGVTEISAYAFYGMSGLTSVTIGDDVTELGAMAFGDCSALTSLHIGKNLVTVGQNALAIPGGNLTITVDADNPSFTVVNGALVNTTTKTLIIGTNTSGIPADGSVTAIGEYAFYGNTMTEITIPATVTKIGAGAFSGCETLTNVYIDDLAKWCTVTLDDDSSNVISFAKNLYVKNGETYELATDLVIPEGVTEIGLGAFAMAPITSVTIPASVTAIGQQAFYATPITKVVFAEGSQLTNIVAYAFYQCANLTSIVIPASVSSIGSQAFYGCSNLKVVYNLSSSITVTKNNTGNGYVGKYAAVVYNAKTQIITNQDGFLFLSADGAYSLIGYVGMESTLTLPKVQVDDTTTVSSYDIATYAFYGNKFVTSVVIPADVTVSAIGAEAFTGCDNLVSVFYGGTAETWSALTNVPASATVYYYSETQPAEAGNYWHYNAEGKPEIWTAL